MRLRLTVLLLALALVAGCRPAATQSHSLADANRDRFTRDRPRLEEAARYTLDAPVSVTRNGAVRLPERLRSLTNSGNAQRFASEGNMYVFMWTGPDAPNVQVGFLYSKSGAAPPGTLGPYTVGPVERLGGNWFVVSLLANPMTRG